MNRTIDQRPRVHVIGGGVAGLVAGWQAAQQGALVTVHEAARTLGGAIGVQHTDGIELNAGAEGFATYSRDVLDLVDELGLSSSVVHPNPQGSWIVNARGAHPMPKRAVLGIPADPGASDVRALIGDDAAERALHESELGPAVGLEPGTTIGACVRERMGDGLVRHFVEPVVGGVYSTDPDLLEMASVNARLAARAIELGSLSRAVDAIRPSGKAPGSSVASLAPSMGALPRTLAAQIEAAGGTVRTSDPVTAIARNAAAEPADPDPTAHLTSTSASGGGTGTAHPAAYRVVTPTSVFEADAVILACDSHTAKRLLAEAAPSVATLIDPVPVSPVMLVTLVLTHPGLAAAPRGNGVLVAAERTDIGAKALTHASAKWAHLAAAAGPDRHVIRLSYGRSGEPLPERRGIEDQALRDASAILGIPLTGADARASQVVVWERAMTQARSGHVQEIAAIDAAAEALPGLGITGSWVAGTGIAAITRHARGLATHIVESLSEPL